jgi:hypothetical protein
VKNLGAGTARYFGRKKTKIQWLWACALVNLRRIWALVEVAAPRPMAVGA